MLEDAAVVGDGDVQGDHGGSEGRSTATIVDDETRDQTATRACISACHDPLVQRGTARCLGLPRGVGGFDFLMD